MTIEQIRPKLEAYTLKKIARLSLDEKKCIADLHDQLIPYDKGQKTNYQTCSTCFNKSADRLMNYIRLNEVKKRPRQTRKKKEYGTKK